MTKQIFVILAAGVLFVSLAGVNVGARQEVPTMAGEQSVVLLPAGSQRAIVEEYCVSCHNPAVFEGELSLMEWDLAEVEADPVLAEKVIRKLRAGMMPPPGAPRPAADTLHALAASVESNIDLAAARNPTLGDRTLQRLNRVEYANSVRALLDLDIDVTALLPPDSAGRGFDNIADALTLSPALLEGYVRAASKISRIAVGDPDVSPTVETYGVPRTASQMRHVEGAPYGTRGGTSVIHNFPADGEYVFKMEFYPTPTGGLFGKKAPDEKIEVSVDGARVAILDIDPQLSEGRDGGTFVQTVPITVSAGPHRVSAAFIQHFTGPIDDLLRPIEHTIADSQISEGDGITVLPHLQALGINGPYNATGVSDTPARRIIFSCRPLSADEEASCAEEIVTGLASQAYRRSVSEEDLEGLLDFYRIGREEGDFEEGVRTSLQAILTSPNFVFRFEHEPEGVQPGETFRISDVELASRLSYFLWSTVPDEELLTLADQGRLHEPAPLEAQVRRMLADPRAETLATRFAAQWLRLKDLDGIIPDPLLYAQFDSTLAVSMRRETELLFDSVVREDRNLLDLLEADYTFVDERLAKHYGIANILGSRFRRVPVTMDERRGLLGHGSILTMTSIADRTSPVQRGKWVMEVLLGTPPPPPPPNVPELEETEAVEGDRLLTLRERLEIHRGNPFCSGCHNMIDPLGLALENFDVTGRWREFDAGLPIDPSGELFDGTLVDGPSSLREALLNRSDSFIRNFTENLMMYALGRRVEYYDMPTIRQITRNAEEVGNRFSSFVVGIVGSPAFQMRVVQQSTEAAAN